MANASAATPETLQPTWFGYIRTTRDVCILVELVMSGTLQHIPRRPHERERPDIIKSGNIFIYEEAVSGVKRWTDGVNWSPSRVLGNFLIYREVEQGYPPEGSKKVALKNRPPRGGKPTGVQKKRSPPPGMPVLPYQQYGINNGPGGPAGACPTSENDLCYLEDRELLGSLTDSYPFVDNGLIKKTISLMVRGVNHHVVSYYRPSHVRSGELKTPSTEPAFAGISPRDDLLRNSGLRVPLEQEEYKINENSEAYITQAQAQANAQAEAHELYRQQQQQAYQHSQLYQPRPSHHSHGLPDPALPTVALPGMATYGQPPFNLQAGPSALQAASHFPAHTPSSLTGTLQNLAQDGMEAIGGAHYQQTSPHGFVSAEQEAYPFPGGSSRHSSFASNQAAVYNTTPTNAYPSAHDASFTPTHSAYASTQNNGYVPSPAPAYPGPRDYRQSSIAASQNGYIQLLPGSSPPGQSPTPRDIQGVTGVQVVPKSEPLDWTAGYTGNTQGHDAASHDSQSMPQPARSQTPQTVGAEAATDLSWDDLTPRLTQDPETPGDIHPETPSSEPAQSPPGSATEPPVTLAAHELKAADSEPTPSRSFMDELNMAFDGEGLDLSFGIDTNIDPALPLGYEAIDSSNMDRAFWTAYQVQGP